ncbi:DeoR/GlpR family DNA-binding transcription regulator [Euzebyella saccharophila]|uniref:DeoR/GlpR family DNA-binding transcription regulator n=1 Tax=Euzebyella saccharophila TaxID=679664 RepID=A0ABV8JSP9_9FLAO|nr:DeoR/GlpR family DNA-binding transcription regulator [Euzebyella saccharophila]
MLKQERQQVILNEVALHNRVLLTDIADVLNVSVDTIRRDVIQLDSERKLKKVHGGAISLGYTNEGIPQQRVYALEKKSKIADKAVQLLKSGNVIIVHGGTTCLEFAKKIPSNLSLTCFTMSLPIALELAKKPKVEVIIIGGTLSKESLIASGANAIHNLSKIRVDYSFLGTGYADANYGLTEFDWESVQVKKAIVQSSKKAVLLTISEKLNSQNRYKTCDLQEISIMITELSPSDSKLEDFREKNITLL